MKVLTIIMVCFALLACKSNVSSQEIKEKTEMSFSKINLKKGTRNVSITNMYGKRWKLRLNFPEPLKVKNSLIIALHWAGGGDTYIEFNDCLATPGLSGLNAIVATPEGENQLWSTENNIDKIRSIITNAIKYWNVDPKKVAIMGYSNGGNGSWYFAEHFPELISAAIPMASSYAINKKVEVPLYAIHGAKDELFPVKRTTQYVNQTKNAGSDVTLSINERLSHFQGCAYVDELKRAAEWLKKLWEKQ